jgi:hypothetical protein
MMGGWAMRAAYSIAAWLGGIAAILVVATLMEWM